MSERIIVLIITLESLSAFSHRLVISFSLMERSLQVLSEEASLYDKNITRGLKMKLILLSSQLLDHDLAMLEVLDEHVDFICELSLTKSIVKY